MVFDTQTRKKLVSPIHKITLPLFSVDVVCKFVRTISHLSNWFLIEQDEKMYIENTTSHAN